MAFSSKLHLLLFFFHLFLSTTLQTFKIKDPSSNCPIKDIPHLLHEYNLPGGLLPANVMPHFCPDKSFRIELAHPCRVQFKDKWAFYHKTITGKLDYGKVSEVNGIQARKLFMWVAITGLEVDEKSNEIVLAGRWFRRSVPADRFLIFPTCQDKEFT